MLKKEMGHRTDIYYLSFDVYLGVVYRGDVLTLSKVFVYKIYAGDCGGKSPWLILAHFSSIVNYYFKFY